MNVPVMLLLSLEPAIDIYLEPFFAKLCLPTGIYFKGVWLRLRMRQNGTLCSSAIVTMSWRYTSWASFLAPSGISSFLVVDICFTKPIRLDNLLAHEDKFKSMCPRLSTNIVEPFRLANPAKRASPRNTFQSAFNFSLFFGSWFPFVKIEKSLDGAFV